MKDSKVSIPQQSKDLDTDSYMESFSRHLLAATSKRALAAMQTEPQPTVTTSPVERVDAELMMQLIRGRTR